MQEVLTRIKPSEGILRLYKRVLVSEANSELGRLNTHIKTLREQMNDLDKTRVNTLRKYAEDTITIQEKSELIDSLDVQRLAKSNELEQLQSQQNIREADIESAINVMDNVDKQWKDSELDIQFRFQSMLFPQGLVYDSVNHRFGTSSISPLYRCIAKQKDLPETEKSFLVAGPGLEPGTSWL